MYLVTALLAISTLAGPAEAMFVSAAPHQDPAGVGSIGGQGNGSG
jgi:hypothetical protein